MGIREITNTIMMELFLGVQCMKQDLWKYARKEDFAVDLGKCAGTVAQWNLNNGYWKSYVIEQGLKMLSCSDHKYYESEKQN